MTVSKRKIAKFVLEGSRVLRKLAESAFTPEERNNLMIRFGADTFTEDFIDSIEDSRIELAEAHIMDFIAKERIVYYTGISKQAAGVLYNQLIQVLAFHELSPNKGGRYVHEGNRKVVVHRLTRSVRLTVGEFLEKYTYDVLHRQNEPGGLSRGLTEKSLEHFEYYLRHFGISLS